MAYYIVVYNNPFKVNFRIKIMAEYRWYDSKIAEGIGIAAILASLGWGIATCMRGCANMASESELEKMRIEKSCQIQEADLNGNGIPDKFYSINGRIAVVELDGKPISDFYRK